MCISEFSALADEFVPPNHVSRQPDLAASPAPTMMQSAEAVKDAKP
jgi:hypothetical protein